MAATRDLSGFVEALHLAAVFRYLSSLSTEDESDLPGRSVGKATMAARDARHGICVVMPLVPPILTRAHEAACRVHMEAGRAWRPSRYPGGYHRQSASCRHGCAYHPDTPGAALGPTQDREKEAYGGSRFANHIVHHDYAVFAEPAAPR